jgi:hypothetical protein
MARLSTVAVAYPTTVLPSVFTVALMLLTPQSPLPEVVTTPVLLTTATTGMSDFHVT